MLYGQIKLGYIFPPPKYSRRSESEIRKGIKEIITDQLGVYNIKDDTTLGSVGADGLDLVEIAVWIEESFAVDMPMNRPNGKDTIKTLVQLVKSAKPLGK